MPITITMPAMSPTMEEGTLATWLVKEGDKVQAGDMLAEIETDKATMELEAIDDGTVGKLLVAEGTEGVLVNAPILLLLEEDEDASALADFQPAASAAPAAPAVAAEPKPTDVTPAPASVPAPVSAPSAVSAPPPSSGSRVFASPLARRIAAQNNIDITAVSGSGPHGRIIKQDVEKAIAAPKPAAAAVATPKAAPTTAGKLPFEPAFDLEPLSTMRKTIARRLTESKQQIPHFYLTIDCEIDELLDLRKELNARADGAFKLSVNDLVIKAVAVALKKVPAANSSYTDEGIKLYQSADVAVAVATEQGLITPIIRNAGDIGLEAISNNMKELAQKARDRKLMPEDYQGGTFSISNLGMFGIKQFEAVINPPQACILAVGVGEQLPVVKDGALAIANVMTCSLSTDHRAVDGVVGAEFLTAFKSCIEYPMSMLL
jgi:pyruvate dehydrogenase E2 component (dihydrolipoamide acetyltransferase)